MTQATVATAGAPGGARRRGGGSGAPATDPRTITDFEDVAAIPFVFARHPVHHEAHMHMNNMYSADHGVTYRASKRTTVMATK